MQNKPNSLNVQIYISVYDTKDYENFIPLAGQKNKPNSNPIKANLVRRRRIAERVKLMQSVYLQRIMKKNAAKGYEKTNPIQTQFPKWPKWTQISLSQRIMKMNHLKAPKKQTQTNPILPPILKISFLNFVKLHKILTTYEISF